MANPPHISREERDTLLRDARSGPSAKRWGTKIPVRTVAPPGSRDGGHPSVPPPGHAPIGLPRRRRFGRILLAILGLLAALLVLGAGKFLHVGSAVLSQERSVIGQVAELLFRRGKLAGEAENGVNILLVAVGGEGHQGENLTDSVMLIRFRPQERDVALLSIPRDLYVNIPGTELYTRINAVHAYGENQRRGEGLRLIKEKVASVTGQLVHYVARVDFLAFKRIVDELGGIDITIDQAFYDYWHRISFPAGREHMNGERALAYVRARYIEGPAGGDFKRAERTQRVLLAIRQKIFSVQTAVDLRALAGILDTLKTHVATNFTLSELKRLADFTRGITQDRIRTAVLDTGPHGLLTGSTEILGGRPASVLRPRAGLEKYDEIHQFTANIFTEGRVSPTPAPPDTLPGGEGSPSPSTSASPRAESGDIFSEQPTVDVRNGTAITGFAARVAKTLEKQQFTIIATGNGTTRNRTASIIVDRTNGKKPASLRALQAALGVSTTVSIPESEKLGADANFLIFLGTDLAPKFRK